MGTSYGDPRSIFVSGEIFMRRLRAWCLRFAGLFHKEQLDCELAEELESHLQLHIEDNLRAGMSPAEARRQAHLKLGGIEQTKEKYRARRGIPLLESVLQDLRFGVRMLRKNPGFTAVAVLTLALGIGANTAIFSVVNAVLLRPLPFPEADRLTMIWHTPPRKSFPGVARFVVSPANYLDWRSQNHVFDQMAAIGFRGFNLTGMGQPESVTAATVSADFFSVLRVQPSAGRGFVTEDDQPGGGNVVVVSHAFRQSHYGPNENILGKTIRLNDENYLIIGVMPPRFAFPSHAQLWIPLAWRDKQRAVRGNHNFLVIARLKSGVEREKAQVEMDTISDDLARQYPIDDAGWGAVVVPLQDSLVGSLRSSLLVLLSAVAFVLLIACTNVANLTLARALGRRKEIAIRAALGASRGRVMRQVLTETVLLSVTGGAFALLLAHFVIDSIAALIGPQLQLSVVEIGIDRWVLGFTLAISILTGIIAGLAPSWHLAKANLNASLKQGLGKTDSDSSGDRARNVFVVAEVALSLLLLVGAGLTIRTLYLLQRVNPGIDPHNVLIVPLAISGAKYPSTDQQTNFFNNVLDRVRALPGVEFAGAIDNLPFQSGSMQPVIAEGQPVVPMADQPEVSVCLVSPGYLRAMRIPLEQGRDLADADKANSEPVILVSDAFAKRFWPHENPIGKHVTLTFVPGPSREVVGVVGDVKLEGLDATRPVETIYDAMSQNVQTQMVLTVRTSSMPTNLTSAVTSAVHSVDPDEPLVGIVAMDSIMDQSLGQQRLNVILLAVFGGLALLLGAIGIYGVQSYAVRQRIREIGIRIALGAQRSNVFRLVLGQGLKLALIGICIGLAASFELTRLMASQLYGLSATDPLTFAGVAIVLAFVALLACYFPARRATRVDPMIALRHE
jgi:putative ABC transport system permease protein